MGEVGPVTTSGTAPGDPAVVELVRRLQRRIDDQSLALRMLEADQQHPEVRARLAELLAGSQRMRRDGEGLLLLTGAAGGPGRGTPRALSEVLADVVAVVQEPARVALRPPPGATLTPTAAGDLLHVLAEVVDQTAAQSDAGARVALTARVEADGGLVVDVVADGFVTAWHDGSSLAERLAARSAAGVRLQRPLIEDVPGLVATVRCPRSAVVLGAQPPGPAWGGPPPPGPARGGPPPGWGPPPSRGAADELFGPLPVGAAVLDETPIFEAVASAWFRRDAAAAPEWDSPTDREWRAAAARAAQAGPAVPEEAMPSGLPRRRPGDRLVAPPRATAGPPPAPDERVPERVRDRLATYQRGLRQGRHRADDPNAEGWPEAGW